MSTPTDDTKLTFRRYKDGDAKVHSKRDRIFQASHSYKCPTYIQSTPPCQGSWPDMPNHPTNNPAISRRANPATIQYHTLRLFISKPPLGRDLSCI